MPAGKILNIALTILALMFGTNLSAEVEIYGRAHLSVDVLDDGDDSGVNLSSNGSRIGFRTAREVVPGLQGRLQLEQEIRYDNGGGNFTSRDSFVGLEGGFGGVRLGHLNTPLKNLRGEVDFFNDQLGDARNLTRLNQSVITPAADPVPAVAADFDARFSNGIHYYTPELGGFRFNLQHSTNTNAGTNPPNDTATANSAALVYKTGDLYLAVGHEQQEEKNDSKATRLGARYKMGDLTLAGLVQQATLKPTAVAAYDIDAMGLGAGYKLTETIIVKGQVYVLSDDRDERDARLFAIGVDYVFDRQFRLLFVYAIADNDDLAAYRVSAGGHGDQVATIAGEQAQGLSAGFYYDFN